MVRRAKKRIGFLVVSLMIFVVIAAGVFLLAQFITKTGLFKIPGVVYYDESLSEEELTVLHDLFNEDVELDKDVVILAKNYLDKPTLSENEYLYKVMVPVTDFYSSEYNIDISDVDSLFNNTNDEESGFNLIDVNDLSFDHKLLQINHKYYLNDYASGALFRVISFVSDKFDEEIKPIVDNTYRKEFPTKDNVLSFVQTGVTALSRGMNRKLYEVGDATYFSSNIKDYLSSFDLTHTSNESSFSPFANGSNICSDSRFIDTLTSIGLDIVELTGNHNQDCGDDSALSTIDTYLDNGIKIVGGGKTADDAAIPLEIDEKNSKITFLAYNLSTGGATYDNTPGANQYYEESAAKEIREAKDNGDYVIIDIQYYECSAYVSTTEDYTCDYANSSAGDQIRFFRHLIDLGADMVVGTSAHQPQTFELYGDGVIYYGLGNLFFDQIWWPGTTRSLMLEHYFYNSKLLQTKITPSVYGSEMQTMVMDEDEAASFIQRLVRVKP